MLKKLIQQLIKRGLWKGVKKLLRSRSSMGKHPESLVSDEGVMLLRNPHKKNLLREFIDNYHRTGVWDYSIFKEYQDGLRYKPETSEEDGLYEKLAEVNELSELLPNSWFDVYGNEYYLTKKGFISKGNKI